MTYLNKLIELRESKTLRVVSTFVESASFADGKAIAKTSLDNAKHSIYFKCGDYDEDLSNFKIVPELVVLPFDNCWFEVNSKKSEELFLVNCFVSKTGNTMMAVYTSNHLCKDWMLVSTGFFQTTLNSPCRSTPEFCELTPYIKELAIFSINCVKLFLSAMNCTNVKRTEHKPDDALQKARAKRGKLPLFSYWTLELTGTTNERGEHQGGTHSSPRVHLRRGHPRQYVPGKYTWVQACAVGNKSLGMVHKDYRLKSCQSAPQ